MDLVVEYNKNDFLYYTTYIVGKDLTLLTPDDKNVDCNTTPESDLGKELCYNKKLADQLLDRTALHSGSDEMYANTISKYNSERLTTLNLAIGIMVGIGAIMNFR
jgi:hypothetical protein